MWVSFVERLLARSPSGSPVAHGGNPQSFDWVWRGDLATPLAQALKDTPSANRTGSPLAISFFSF
ncbi:MAG: hypothetical protein AAFQ80_02920 [Cyanobacteria bacterium J06621_8]